MLVQTARRSRCASAAIGHAYAANHHLGGYRSLAFEDRGWKLPKSRDFRSLPKSQRMFANPVLAVKRATRSWSRSAAGFGTRASRRLTDKVDR